MKSTAAPTPETAEKQAAVRTIRKLMDFWHIEAHELSGVKIRPVPVAPEPIRPHYRHPISQLTWNGIGAQPDWLREALLREGYTVEELRRCALDAATA